MTREVKLTEREITIITRALGLLFVSTGKKDNKLLDKLIKPHKRIKVSSAKAKGRNLQKWAVEKIAKLLDYELSENKDESHIRSREMGQSGVDVVLSKKAKKKFPFSIECKNQEQINLPVFFEQAKTNTSEFTIPLLIVKNKKLKEPLLIMEWCVFELLYRGINKYEDVILD